MQSVSFFILAGYLNLSSAKFVYLVTHRTEDRVVWLLDCPEPDNIRVYGIENVFLHIMTAIKKAENDVLTSISLKLFV